MRSSWMAYRAIEQAGLGVLPPVTSDTALQDSYQGGILPAVGSIIGTGVGYGEISGLGSVTGAQTRPAPLVRGGRDVMAYTRAGNNVDVAEITLKFHDESSATLRFTPSTRELELICSSKGTVWKKILEPSSETRILAFKINSVGTRVWLSRTESVLVTECSIPDTAVLLEATGRRIVGVKVDYLTDWEDGGRRVQSMRQIPIIQLSALETLRIPALRGYENVTAEKIVSDWCAATLGTVWVDEEGRLNLAARDRLAAGKPTITDTLSERVFAGAWRTARDGVRGGVVVKSQEPMMDGHDALTLAVAYQPDNIIELVPNETKEIFYTLPTEVDVIGLDTAFRPVIKARDGIYDWAGFNKPTGSWWAISFENRGQPEGYRWTGAERHHEILSASLETLGQRTIKMTFRVDTNGTSGIEKYYLVTPTIATDLRYGNRGVPMPIIRANWVVTWVDRVIRVSSGAVGTDFELEAGWWLHPQDAQRVAEALASEIGTERVTFDSLSMLWDPRKQIGDSHILQADDEQGARWEAEYILTGYKESWEGNVPTCSYDLAAKRVTDTRAGKTYADMATAYTTYSTIPSNKTYGDIYAALPERSQ